MPRKAQMRLVTTPACIGVNRTPPIGSISAAKTSPSSKSSRLRSRTDALSNLTAAGAQLSFHVVINLEGGSRTGAGALVARCRAGHKVHLAR